MQIYHKLTDLIGNTPLLELGGIQAKHSLGATLLAKLEYFNPLGSVKDRAAFAMICEAEQAGLLQADSVIVEATSGNTGVGLAFIGAVRGYRVILTMPETMSGERRGLLEALGAEIVLTPGFQGMKGSIDQAEQLCKELPHAFMPNQFENSANPRIHEKTTAEEIWRDTDGKVDILVSAFGSGGTITGTGKALKAKNPDIKIIGVEPASSAVVSGDKPGPHKIQGIGAGFVPETLDLSVVDEVITVSNESAYATTRELSRVEGLLVGISSGAAVSAARRVAARDENRGKNIVVILPDTGERYLSTGVYSEDTMG